MKEVDADKVGVETENEKVKKKWKEGVVVDVLQVWYCVGLCYAD